MIFLWIFLLIVPQPGEPLLGVVTEVFNFAYSAYGIANDAHDAYNKWKKQTSLDDILNVVTSLTSKIDQMEARIESKLDDLYDKLITRLPRLGQRARAMEELSRIIEEIDYLYEFFEFAVANSTEHISNHSLERFVETVTSLEPERLMSLLNHIHSLIVPQRSAILRDSLLELIREDSQGPQDNNQCGNQIQGPTLISEIYTTLVVTEIRGLIVLGFAYTTLELIHNESYAAEITFATKKMKDRCADYLDTFTQARYLPSEIRNCDPPGGYVRDETYYEFERFRTRYILSASGFNNPPSCKKPFDSNNAQVSCEASKLCTEENRCRGHLIDCAGESYAWICPVEDKNSSRRYWDVSNSRGRWTGLGKEKNCQFDTNQFLKVYTDSNNDDCDIYYCDCIEDSYDSYSMRTLSYRPQISDIEDNKVVTGVRLVTAERMIHIQIQQGVILPQGNVDPETVEWKPLENIHFDEQETLKEKKLTYRVHYDNGTEEVLKEGEDFGAFSITEDVIDLDDITLTKDYVITDEFTWDWDDKKKARWIEVHATPYDYLVGNLILEHPDYRPKWLMPEDMKGVLPAYDKPRSSYDIGLENLRNPTTLRDETKPNAGPNSAVTLTRTELALDAGQTVLPFLDSRAVIATPPFALGTIGLFLKSVSPFQQGFLAFRIAAMDTIASLQL